MKKRTKTSTLRELKNITNDFYSNLNDIFHFKFNIIDAVNEKVKEINNLIEILEPIKDLKNTEGLEFSKYINVLERRKLDNAPNIIYPMCIVYAIAHFEVYISKITFLLLSYYWQSLMTKEKSLNYEEILSSSNIYDLKEYIINKEVQKVSFGSIKNRISYLEKKFNLVFEYKRLKGIRDNWNSIELDDLIEIHSTRNLIIHNNSIINQIYLNENPKSNFKIGELREIKKEYALDALSVLFRVGFSFQKVAEKKIKNIK